MTRFGMVLAFVACADAPPVEGRPSPDVDTVAQAPEVPSAAAEGTLLVADASGVVFRVALDGAVTGGWSPEIEALAGVAWDPEGRVAWVSSRLEGEPLVALDLDGAEVARVQPVIPPRSRQGLHVASGQVVSKAVNVNGIDVVQYLDPGTGELRIETGLYDDGFLTSLWGVHVAGEASVQAELWATRGSELVHWDGEAATVIGTSASDLLGLTTAGDGTLWAIDAGSGELWRLDAAGTVLETLPAPGASPTDLAWVPSG